MVIDYVVPQLFDCPQQAALQLEQLVQANSTRRIGLIGSSMGGFHASVLAAKFACKAVLVNPVVAPHKLMANYLGEQVNPYTQNHFVLSHDDMNFLQKLDVECPEPENILLLAQTGDETLDYSLAVAKYSESEQVVEEGGDHRFQHYEKHLPKIIEFLFAPSIPTSI